MNKMTNRRILLFMVVCCAILLGGQTCPENRHPQNTHLRECINWCNGVDGCVACSTLSDCGAYYTDMNSFGGIWYACRARDSWFGDKSEDHRRDCIEYCEDNSDRCDFCSTLSDCGPNYRDMGDSFSGTGRNWHACEDNTLNSLSGQIERGTISLPSHTEI